MEIATSLPGTDLEVTPLIGGKPGPPLMGRTEANENRLAFVPVVPLLAGQRYRASWQSANGRESLEFLHKAPPQTVPGVTLTPAAPLPANALKIYLHFTQPMEQGVFLDRLRLLDATGKEVIGPFRETELWSPDGKRLTVWFHPGRQKAGVNLNIEEGPVLHPKARYTLEVSGAWRSTAGTALGKDQTFAFTVLDADHECPQTAKWRLVPPQVGTQDPLRVEFDEGLDPAMLRTALHLRRTGEAEDIQGDVAVHPAGRQWSLAPNKPWAEGGYELRADPDLEDFAGNSLIKPFEVDISAPVPAVIAPTVLRFTLGPAH